MQSINESLDAIVISGGVSGLAVSALLARRGKHVIIGSIRLLIRMPQEQSKLRDRGGELEIFRAPFLKILPGERLRSEEHTSELQSQR